MCGLYGYITKTGRNDSLTLDEQELRNRLLTSLAVAMQSRGEDSTGLAIVKRGEAKIVKKATTALEFVRSSSVKKALLGSPNIVIGHTRLATSGAVCDKNAHPFQKGSIIGAHNGVVSNHLEIDGKVQVDSEVIFSLLHKDKNDFEKTFKKLSGMFAITWMDTRDPNSVYLVRQDQPLAIVSVRELSSVFWASSMIALAATLQATLGLQHKDIWVPKENTVYKINGNSLQIERFKVKFKEDRYVFNQYCYQGTNYRDRDCLFDDATDYSEDEAMWDTVENGCCDSCSGQIQGEKGFYWDCTLYKALCLSCFRKYVETSIDWEYISPERYEKIAESARLKLTAGTRIDYSMADEYENPY